MRRTRLVAGLPVRITPVTSSGITTAAAITMTPAITNSAMATFEHAQHLRLGRPLPSGSVGEGLGGALTNDHWPGPLLRPGCIEAASSQHIEVWLSS